MRQIRYRGFPAFATVVVAGLLTILTGSAGMAAESAATTTTYKMSNGMDVILKENHSSPMISSVVFVRSGSKYETDYNNGATHFLEHLLFNGTATRTQEEISDRVKNLGGYINAFTRKEVTAYMSLVPAEYIGEALDIQQDMLFNSIFPDNQFPKERKIVIEEIRKDSDSPDYIAEGFYDRWAYNGSPYARPVIGYENLIATIPRQAIIDYYHTYYQPNNMTVLLIGDFETDAMQTMLEDTFGQHPAQSLPKRPAIAVPPVRGRTIKRTVADIAETHVDYHIRLPRYTDPSYYPLTLLTEVLGERALSPLQRRLTQGENPPATRASASLETQEEFCALRLSITASDPSRVDEIIATTDDVLRNLSALEITTDDVRAIATRLKVEDIFLREKLHYYAIMKAPMIAVTGYEFVDELAPRLAAVTLDEVRGAAASHLTGSDCVITVVTPKPAAANAPTDVIAPVHTSYARHTLANGIPVIVKSNPGSRVFAISVLGKHRSASEPEGMGGISDFVNRMLESGTATRSADDISRALTAIGGDITTNDNPYIPYDDRYTTPQYTFVKFATIDEFASAGTELLADMLGNSTFPEEELEKTRKQVMGILGMASGNTGQACRGLFYESLFGEGPYADPVLGSHASVAQFNSEALTKHLHTLYAPENMIVTCVTNLGTEETIALLERTFGQIPTGTPPHVTVPLPLPPQGEMAAHKPMEKEQIYIYLGGLTPGATDPDAAAVIVAARILSSRLAKELRERQGLAYSVGASVRFDRDFGWQVCTMGTGKENFAVAREGILAELRRLQEELPGEDEIEIAQNALWGSSLMRQLSRINQAYYMGVNEFLGLGYDYSGRFVDDIRAVRPADIQRVARLYFDPDNYILATVGMFE